MICPWMHGAGPEPEWWRRLKASVVVSEETPEWLAVHWRLTFLRLLKARADRAP